MPAIGAMLDRYRFQQRGPATVSGGIDLPGEFADVYVCAAVTLYLRGSEAVQAARLQGDQPVVLTIRACSAARAIDNTWRAVDARDAARVLDVTSTAPNKDIAFIDVLAVQRRGEPNG